jgi:Peptidase family M28
MRDAVDRALTRPRARSLAALVVVLLLAALGYWSVTAVMPPAAQGAGAAADRFSATRAYAHAQAIAVRPHPVGSDAQHQARDYLMTSLRQLGLSPQLQDTTSVQGGGLASSAGGPNLAHVQNVVAAIPGRAPTGRVFLMAHYDSVQNGPGGNDDGAGVSTVLEVARALTTGPALRNDVVLVLTDGEEACLCGAEAFADQNPLAKGGGIVLNAEARGRSGPAVMFETSPDNAELVRAYGHAPEPAGTSFAVEIYRLLPNDTDFSAFKRPGFSGLNSAYIDGAAVYHAPADQPSTMSRRSLQQHGDNELYLARTFGDRDLATLTAGGDATYFPTPGGQLTYPGGLVWPLAAAALLAVLLLAVLVRLTGRASAGRMVAAFLLTLVPILLTPVLAQVFWIVLGRIRPAYQAIEIDPYRPQWYRLAVVAITALVLFVWYALLRRRFGPAAMAVGAFGWLAVFGVVLAAVAPGGSYLTAIPALAGAIGGMLAVAFRGGWLSVLCVLLAAAVAVIVLLPTLVMFFPAMGMALAAAGGFVAVLLGLALVPVIDLLHPEAGGQRGLDAGRARRGATLPALIALAAVVVFAVVGLRMDRFDAAHPIPTQLMYALDTDNGTAQWLSPETRPQAWTRQYVSGAPHTVTGALPAFGAEKLTTGTAPTATLAPSLITLNRITPNADGTRTLHLTVIPQRRVRLLAVHVAEDVPVTAAVAGGRSVPIGTPIGDGWGFGFVFHAPPPAGLDVTLTVRTAAPVRIRVMDGSDGLDGLPGFRPRPAGVGIAGSHISELCAVTRTYQF